MLYNLWTNFRITSVKSGFNTVRMPINKTGICSLTKWFTGWPAWSRNFLLFQMCDKTYFKKYLLTDLLTDWPIYSWPGSNVHWITKAKCLYVKTMLFCPTLTQVYDVSWTQFKTNQKPHLTQCKSPASTRGKCKERKIFQNLRNILPFKRRT